MIRSTRYKVQGTHLGRILEVVLHPWSLSAACFTGVPWSLVDESRGRRDKERERGKVVGREDRSRSPHRRRGDGSWVEEKRRSGPATQQERQPAQTGGNTRDVWPDALNLILFIYLSYSKYGDFISNRQNVAKRDEQSTKRCQTCIKPCNDKYIWNNRVHSCATRMSDKFHVVSLRLEQLKLSPYRGGPTDGINYRVISRPPIILILQKCCCSRNIFHNRT